ncbi:aspartate kinase [Fusobacterium mortiferum]|uniref:Aspartokinase n=1 Tax=Fusobacterium mortiferum TaxID=850 RepID=A0ABS2G1H0_FUSMR|nr:aspartate kinase [Fusobacterium mortiferum]MBM6821573.1 aspartate kinase [Fusobacterium mortiferum]MBM6874615.1 aspartate kinase [Fusobacterium mortiferum]
MRIVLKYGGSSVATIEKIQQIADYLIELKKEYKEIVVVASAMGKTTDGLIKLAKEITPNPNQRELDSLMSIGEQQTVALMAMALTAKGQKALSLTGYQAGIKTAGVHTKNKIQNISSERIERHLAEGNIVLVTGFQGINEAGDITTLGRGGSDTSAVALAVALKCECRIYTDVEGIYSVDPRVYPEAKFLDKISYEEMMEMANLGAGVMETRAVELGKKYNIPIFVGKSLSKTGGTYIMEKNIAMEDKLVTGVSITKEIIVTTISNILFSSENVAEIFSTIDSCGLNINMITQNINKYMKVEISFSCQASEKYLLEQVTEKIKGRFSTCEIELNENLGMISIVGVGMINNSGIAGKFFSVLSKNGVNFYQVTTSEISISCSIDRENIQRAVEAVGREFSL